MQIVTERESWILGNLEAKPGLTVEQNAAMIEPGLEHAPQKFREGDVCGSEAGDRYDRQVSHGKENGRRSC